MRLTRTDATAAPLEGLRPAEDTAPTRSPAAHSASQVPDHGVAPTVDRRLAANSASPSSTSGIARLMTGQTASATSAIDAAQLSPSAKAQLRKVVINALTTGKAPQLMAVVGGAATGKTSGLIALASDLARHGLIDNDDWQSEVPLIASYAGQTTPVAATRAGMVETTVHRTAAKDLLVASLEGALRENHVAALSFYDRADLDVVIEKLNASGDTGKALAARFGAVIDLPDLTSADVEAIIDERARKGGWTLQPGVMEAAIASIDGQRKAGYFGNAGAVTILFQTAVSRAAARGGETTLTAADFAPSSEPSILRLNGEAGSGKVSGMRALVEDMKRLGLADAQPVPLTAARLAGTTKPRSPWDAAGGFLFIDELPPAK